MFSKIHLLSMQLLFSMTILLGLPSTLKANNITVTCEGFGADRSLSMRQALDQCRSIGSDQAKGSLFKIKQLAVQTNEENAWYSEISMEAEVRGLTCKKLSEKTEQKENGEYYTALTCKFDLAKAEVVPTMHEEPQSIIRSEARHITIWSVPACTSIFVRGARPRSIRCSASPQTLRVYDGEDKDLTITAKGFLPQTIKLEKETEVLNVLFSRR